MDKRNNRNEIKKPITTTLVITMTTQRARATKSTAAIAITAAITIKS